MNKTKIREVAMALLNATLATRKKGQKIGYNQGYFEGPGVVDMSGHECGTNACIAGWVVLLNGQKICQTGRNVSNVSERARKLLGINATASNELFQGFPTGFDHGPTNKDAALVLFNLAETGKVDWDAVRPSSV